KSFRDMFGDLNIADHTLTREPKGYEKDNPAIKYLKLKSFVALQSLSDSELTSKDLLPKLMIRFEAIQPLIHFLNRSLAE
ncbi:MAG: DUF2461 domain-containing protein, partial [Chitinophagaceae bacterium]|nr:DUF2461 domain-containing protein [Chitinophagaceae bacterium]